MVNDEPGTPTPRCDAEGCNSQRTYFDQHGGGYCKPHADEHIATIASATGPAITRPRRTRAGAHRKKDVSGRFVTKLTPKVIETFEQALTGGATHEHAAAYAGISRESYYLWLRRASEPDPDLLVVRLRDAAEVGFATWGVRMAAAVTEAGLAGDGRTALEALSRRAHREWGRKDRMEVGNADGQPFQLLSANLDLARLAELSDEQLTVLRAALALLEPGKPALPPNVIEMRPPREALGE